MLGDEALDRVEVLVTDATQLIDVLWPARLGVRLAVGDARFAEAAIAARCRPTNALCLEQHDAALGVFGLQLDRGPETRVAAADHHVVGLQRAG